MLFAALAILTTSSKCGNASSKTEQTQTDSVRVGQNVALVFDSVEYHASNADSTFTCDIIVDVPHGNDSLAVAVKRFLSDELAALSLGNIMSDQATPQHSYKGSLDKPQDIVDFYGKLNEKKLQADQKELEERAAEFPPFVYHASIRKTDETDKYITFQSQTYCYLGGAHGAATYHGINVLIPSGKVLTETVDTTKTKALQSIIRKGIVQYLSDDVEIVTEKNVTSYLFVDNGIIPLPAVAPYLAADGLHFVYGQYEIGPYALGVVEFTVPYADIKPYLTKEVLQIINDEE